MAAVFPGIDKMSAERPVEDTIALYQTWAPNYDADVLIDLEKAARKIHVAPLVTPRRNSGREPYALRMRILIAEACNGRSSWRNTWLFRRLFYDAKAIASIGPVVTSKFIASLDLKKDATILDAGAGTGRLGKLLAAEGFSNLHALDGSSEMLKVAQEAKVYKSCTQSFLGQGYKTSFPDNHFDAIVMVGVFGPGHFGVDVLPELIRITKPGGILCWGQRDPVLYADRSDAFKDDRFHQGVLQICSTHSCVLEKGPVPLPRYYLEYDGCGYVLRKQ